MSDLHLIGAMIAWHYRRSFSAEPGALCSPAWHKRQAAAMEERHGDKLVPWLALWLVLKKRTRP